MLGEEGLFPLREGIPKLAEHDGVEDDFLLKTPIPPLSTSILCPGMPGFGANISPRQVFAIANKKNRSRTPRLESYFVSNSPSRSTNASHVLATTSSAADTSVFHALNNEPTADVRNP